MSEHEGGDGKVGAFLLGFLVGVLVCLGAGGVFFFMQTERMALLKHEAELMRQQEEAARREAEAAAERARRAVEAVKKAGQ